MSFASLDDISYFSLAGFTLSVEEKSVLAASLSNKKDQEKLSSISFWGKILGLQRDYMIAQSTGATLFERKYYYSLDLVNWLQLPEVTPAEAKRMEQIQGRFQGDPAFEYILDESDLKADEKLVKEDKRLAYVISMINYEAQVVPRGAYYKNAVNVIEANPNFGGLSKDTLSNLKSYLHFRLGYEVDSKTLAEIASTYDESLDIFAPVEKDEPQGCWSIQAERGGSVAILRNLVWPGYVFYHAPSANKFGGVYFGTGTKEHPFGIHVLIELKFKPFEPFVKSQLALCALNNVKLQHSLEQLHQTKALGRKIIENNEIYWLLNTSNTSHQVVVGQKRRRLSLQQTPLSKTSRLSLGRFKSPLSNIQNTPMTPLSVTPLSSQKFKTPKMIQQKAIKASFSIDSLLEKNETLQRKLLLYRKYTDSNESQELSRLITKWTQVTKEALEELRDAVGPIEIFHDGIIDSVPRKLSLKETAANLRFDVALLGKYDQESDCFLD